MNFNERYELLGLVRDGSIRTFDAKQRETGKLVSVHLLTGGSSAHPVLTDRLNRLPESARREILEEGEDDDGTVFVVTGPWLREASFGDWVLTVNVPGAQSDQFTRAGSWRVPTSEFGRKSAQPAPEPGEFTKMFLSPCSATPPVPEPQGPRPPADPQPEPVPAPDPVMSSPGLFTSMFEADQMQALLGRAPKSDTAEKSGEFTRQFGKQAPPPVREKTLDDTVEIAMPGLPSQPPASSPPPVSPSTNEPGEFTRMFQASAPAKPNPLSAPSPGEFTQYFSAPPPLAEPSAHPGYQNPMGRKTDGYASRSAAGGDFTRMFGSPGVPGDPPQGFGSPPEPEPLPSPKRDQTGEYTRMFRPASPKASGALGSAPAPETVPITQNPGTPEQSGGGDFTRMIRTPPVAGGVFSPNAQAVAPEAQPRPVQKANYAVLFGLLGFLLVLAIALIVFFAVRN